MAINLSVNGELSSDDLKRYADTLTRIAQMAGRTGSAAEYTIERSSSARPAKGPGIGTLGDPAVCYAIYLAAIAAGVPEYIAAAAYQICLNS